MPTQWTRTAKTAGDKTKQDRAEEMGLCDPGDKRGYVLYSFGGAHEHYPTWHSNTELQKKQLIEQIIAKWQQVHVPPLRYPLLTLGG